MASTHGRSTAAGALALAAVLVLATVAALALSPSDTATAQGQGVEGPIAAGPTADGAHQHGSLGAASVGTAERHTGPQGQEGQFVAKCLYSHSASDDPIVFFGEPGLSHRHDFYGAEQTDAFSTPEDLLAQETTCDKAADKAAYWQPTLYDHDEIVVPDHIQAYYRPAPGVDAETVRPFPFGLAMIAGDQTATTPQEGEAAGWVCGASTRFSHAPPDCPNSAPLHMLLTFQDCWDGINIDSADHRAHVAYSSGGECPDSHPVHVPQLTMSVKYPISGTGHDLRLASGNTYSTHGDFLNGWEPEGLEREVDICLRRDVVCDLASNREEEPLFQSQ